LLLILKINLQKSVKIVLNVMEDLKSISPSNKLLCPEN